MRFAFQNSFRFLLGFPFKQIRLVSKFKIDFHFIRSNRTGNQIFDLKPLQIISDLFLWFECRLHHAVYRPETGPSGLFWVVSEEVHHTKSIDQQTNRTSLMQLGQVWQVAVFRRPELIYCGYHCSDRIQRTRSVRDLVFGRLQN